DQCGVVSVFFFQAEDGIRDWSVTGVQTCALPILGSWAQDPILLGGLIYGSYDKPTRTLAELQGRYPMFKGLVLLDAGGKAVAARSEERRVGKECRCRWATEH